MTVPESDLTAMVAAYTSSGEKKWLKVTVTLDGTTYSNVGVRLKGNSSLMQLLGGKSGQSGQGGGATTGNAAPQNLPWLVRLNKYATGQSHEGLHELVVRSSTTSSALNEAVALDMLTAAGLESQKAAYLRFSVNSSAQVLRLAVENPAEDWATRMLTGSGTLYKADAEGDYTYRGTDSARGRHRRGEDVADPVPGDRRQGHGVADDLGRARDGVRARHREQGHVRGRCDLPLPGLTPRLWATGP